MSDPELIRRCRRLEPHIRLEGSVLPTTFVELARRQGVKLPTYDPTATHPPFGDLEPFRATRFSASASTTPLGMRTDLAQDRNELSWRDVTIDSHDSTQEAGAAGLNTGGGLFV
ncbi:MAG: hypothetical protein LT070_05995 [Solirubrobacteraceae bacterium]|nr:hypothetical protein [Solirubrobacteraceae bacterium]